MHLPRAPNDPAPPRAVRIALAPFFCALGLLAWAHPAPVSAQANDSIFQRFSMSREKPKGWQALLEVPVLLRPQTQADAEIKKNLGFNYVSAFRPGNRLYFSRGLGFARMEWEPRQSDVKTVKVKTFTATLALNHLFRSTLVTSYGVGLGVMDGLITFNDDRNFSARLEPFVPLQIGLALRLGRTFQLGLKFVHFGFLRTNPVISNSRILLGLGVNY